ncbi:MAG: ECF transporter S component [Acutalibacteraceae bacterium]|nr:ECF transporter S component [Acutalibacteraceae bacterium]
MTEKKVKIRTLTVGAILTAIVVVLQLMGAFIRFGPFSISLVLIPIVIGAALCNWKVGGWLGLAFGVAVILSGDAMAFFSIDIAGTIITVMAKGILCGVAAGLVYKLFEKVNSYLAVIWAAVVCPVVNTGVFLLGCKLFFFETISQWGAAEGFVSTAKYMFLGLAGGNFLVELGANIILAPVIYRIIKAIKKG